MIASITIAAGLLIILCATAWFLLYFFLRRKGIGEYDPLDAIDQPTTRGNLYEGPLGIKDYEKWRKEKDE